MILIYLLQIVIRIKIDNQRMDRILKIQDLIIIDRGMPRMAIRIFRIIIRDRLARLRELTKTYRPWQ